MNKDLFQLLLIVMKLSIAYAGFCPLLSISVLQFLFHFSTASISCSGGSRSIWATSPNGFPCDSNSNTFSCEYKAVDRCEDANILDVEGNISICAATHPGSDDGICKGASIQFLSSIDETHGLICEGNSACLNTQIITNSKGKVTCQPGANPGTNVATATCGGTEINGKTMFQVISAGCLQCAGGYSCGDNILFKDTGVAGSTFHPVEAGFQGFLGSGCMVVPPPSPTPSKSQSLQCFSGHNTVNIKGKGVVKIEELKVGDFVKTGYGNNEFSRVWSLMHVDVASSDEIQYLQIFSTARANSPIEVSYDHFLFVDGSNDLIQARDVEVGDLIGGHMVSKIETVKRHEMFAPVTQNGKILVTGVPASCYIALLDKKVSPKLQALASHSILAPFRLACSLSYLKCQQEQHLEGGFSKNLLLPIKIGIYVAGICLLLQFLWLIICFPVIIGLTTIEILNAQGRIVTVATVSVGAILFIHQNKIKKK